MEIIHTKSFGKAFRKLNRIQQEKVETAVGLFVTDRTNPALRDHPLKGKLKDLHAFSAAWNLRVIYREEGGFITIFLLDVGSHNQVY
jgi:addiction module RelE/StbE family toxin